MKQKFNQKITKENFIEANFPAFISFWSICVAKKVILNYITAPTLKQNGRLNANKTNWVRNIVFIYLKTQYEALRGIFLAKKKMKWKIIIAKSVANNH